MNKRNGKQLSVKRVYYSVSLNKCCLGNLIIRINPRRQKNI